MQYPAKELLWACDEWLLAAVGEAPCLPDVPCRTRCMDGLSTSANIKQWDA